MHTRRAQRRTRHPRNYHDTIPHKPDHRPHGHAHVPYSTTTPGVCDVCNLVMITGPDGTYLNRRHLTMDQWLEQITTDPRTIFANR